MIINNNEIKAVIFDMDGVLIDTEKYLTKFWCMAAKEFGYDMRLEHAYEIRSLAGVNGANRLKEIFGNEFDYEAVRNRRKELMNVHLKENGIEPKPKLKESLVRIKNAGYKIAVATSTDFDRTSKYLSEIGVFDLFDNIVCANMVKKGKPEPDIYLYVCEQIGLKPSQCIAVEDSPNGLRSAYLAGTNAIMIPDLTEAADKEKDISVYIIDDLEKLANLICNN